MALHKRTSAWNHRNSLLVVIVFGLLVAAAAPLADAGRGGRGGGRGGGHARPSPSKSHASRGSVRSSNRSNHRTPNRGRRDQAGRTGNRQGTNRNAARPNNRPGNNPGTRPGNRPGNQPNRNVNRNVNRKVNVNVKHHGSCSSWNDARRDYYRYRTVNHLIRAGTYALTAPRYSTTTVVAGSTYYYYGGTYYASSGSRYVVVYPPPGAVVYAVPASTTVVYVESTPYYYDGGAYYTATDKPATVPDTSAEAGGQQAADQADGDEEPPEMIGADSDTENFEVVAPPVGATVPYLPDDATEKTVGGTTYHVFNDTYYQPFSSGDSVIYMVVDAPEG